MSTYLGFRKDTGDRPKAVFSADPDLTWARCLGIFMMLFQYGHRAAARSAH